MLRGTKIFADFAPVWHRRLVMVLVIGLLFMSGVGMAIGAAARQQTFPSPEEGVLTFIGWLSSGGSSALAQDTPLALLHPPSAETVTATHPGAAPTPQFLRVTIGLEAGGRTIRMPADPVWVAVHSPHVRVGEAPQSVRQRITWIRPQRAG